MVEVAPTRTDLWQVLAGRAIGTPIAPEDPDVWERVTAGLDAARAHPRLRPGVETVHQVSVRGQPYVMLRSPDRQASYVRLAPDEWDLAQQMDGTRSVAALVGLLARATGKLSPDRVTRVVADLAANRMLEELPVDAFSGLAPVRAGPWPRRLGRSLLAAARGRRIVLGDVDRLLDTLYRAGGRLVFTRPAAILAAITALVGLVLFVRTWAGGGTALFVTERSYAVGGLVLLGLNVVALLAHELGHALGTKHAGRRVPAVGLLFYFGIPSAFVDTTDIWMADRKHRLIATAAGPASALTLAGLAQITAFAVPELAPVAFKLSFAWYLNALFNLNPLMALDGYYLAMDALEIANLRSRGLAFAVGLVRTRRLGWQEREREERYVAAYGLASVLWTVGFLGLSVRMWRDRISGLLAGLWRSGLGGRALVLVFLVGLFAPLVWATVGFTAKRLRRWRTARRRRQQADRLDTRLAALRSSPLGALPPEVLDGLARASWVVTAPAGAVVIPAGSTPSSVLVVADGRLEARRPGDPPATVRLRAGTGDLLAVTDVVLGRAAVVEWRAIGAAELVAIPSAQFRAEAGPHLTLPGVDPIAAEAAIDAAPALAELAPSSRVTLARSMRSVDVAPGKTVTVSGTRHAILVGSGVLADEAGQEFRGGAVVQAPDDDHAIRATTRTRTVLWKLPDVAALVTTPLSTPADAPPAGAHAAGGYPPVTPPPTATPAGDDEADDRLWRRTRWVLLLLLLFALLGLGSNLADATPWAEVPGDRLLVEVVDGTANAIVPHRAGTRTLPLEVGDRLATGEGARIEVEASSTVRLVHRGGATTILCGGTQVILIEVAQQAPTGEPVRPLADLHLDRGVVLADTRSTSQAFSPVELDVDGVTVRAHTAGPPARFAVATTRVVIVDGEVTVAGTGPVEDASDSADRDGRWSVGCAGLGGGGTATLSTGSGSGGTVAAPTTPTPSASGGLATTAAPTPRGTSSPSPSAASPSATATATTVPPTSPTSPTPSPPPPSPSATTATPPPPSPSPSPTATPTAPPDLAWTCTPTALEVPSGGSSTTRCRVTSVDGFSGGVSYACEGQPIGMTCAASPPGATLAVGGSETTDLTVRADARLPAGTYDIDAVVRADDATIVRRVALSVRVTQPPPAPTFTFSCSPTAIQAAPGQSGTSRCQVVSQNGYAGTVRLSCDHPGLDAACTYTDASGTSVSTVTVTAGGTTTITLVVTPSRATPPGSYDLTAGATDGTITRTVPMTVTVG